MIPPAQNAAFVCAMEEVLDVYQRPYEATRPVVCLDEASKQLVKEMRARRPLAPGHPFTIDYEYEHDGTANLFMLFEPLAGRRRRKAAVWDLPESGDGSSRGHGRDEHCRALSVPRI